MSVKKMAVSNADPGRRNRRALDLGDGFGRIESDATLLLPQRAGGSDR
jgi:hypothetical protein